MISLRENAQYQVQSYSVSALSCGTGILIDRSAISVKETTFHVPVTCFFTLFKNVCQVFSIMCRIKTVKPTRGSQERYSLNKKEWFELPFHHTLLHVPPVRNRRNVWCYPEPQILLCQLRHSILEPFQALLLSLTQLIPLICCNNCVLPSSPVSRRSLSMQFLIYFSMFSPFQTIFISLASIFFPSELLLLAVCLPEAEQCFSVSVVF